MWYLEHVEHRDDDVGYEPDVGSHGEEELTVLNLVRDVALILITKNVYRVDLIPEILI